MTPQETIKSIKLLKALRIFDAPSLSMSVDEAISALELKQQIDDFNLTIEDIKAMKEKQMPKKPIYHKEKHGHHTWIKNEDGKIDDWAVASGFCNGPRCEVCGYSFCEHCNPDGYNDTDCSIEYYTCPICGEKGTKEKKYCDCGQALDWSGDDET